MGGGDLFGARAWWGVVIYLGLGPIGAGGLCGLLRRGAGKRTTEKLYQGMIFPLIGSLLLPKNRCIIRSKEMQR